MKSYIPDWEEIFVRHRSDREFHADYKMSLITQQQENKQSNNNNNKKLTKYLNKHFTKEDI